MTAYCIIIHKQLSVAECPLETSQCMWKHRVNGLCKYSEVFANSDFTPVEFAALVGLPPIDSAVVNILRNSLAFKIKHELQDS
jgi:hypothetical protein